MGAEGAVDMGTDCAFYFVDRLFGGSGEAPQQARALSELEQSVVRGIAERILEALKSGWSEHLELTPEITTFASSPESLRAKNRGEAFVTRLAVNLESLSSVLTIALPLQALQSFLQDEHKGGHNRSQAGFEAREYRSAIEGDLRHARMAVSARLAPLSLTARSIADLAVGQVIQTNQHVEMPIEVHINEQPRFVGTLGQVRRHVGVQLTDAAPGMPTRKQARTTSGRIL
jgi:flagellar motor switch protein FliM